MKFALFFLAEYAALFAMSGLMVAFFFGGYISPIFGYNLLQLPEIISQVGQNGITWGSFFAGTIVAPATEGSSWLFFGLQAEQLFWFMIKTYIFIFLAMWVRGTLPRLKPDQLMGFSWKFLIPLSLLNIFLIAIWKYALLGTIVSLAQGNVNLHALQLKGYAFLQPVLQHGQLATAWGVWFVLATGVFLLFFWMMSRLFTSKLEARLAQR